MNEKFLKLTNTAYSILDFLPEHDPLKNKAKEKLLAILENLSIVFSTDGWVSFQKDKAISQIINDIDLFLNYIEISKQQKWIDNINYLIIVKEYNNLKNDLPKPKIFNQELIINSYTQDKPQESQKEKIIDKKDQIAKSYELTTRQKKILDMLNSSEKAQVADILKVLPDVTKRTIRRDLDGLLESGKVVRVGQWNQVFYKALKNDNNLIENGDKNDRTVLLS